MYISVYNLMESVSESEISVLMLLEMHWGGYMFMFFFQPFVHDTVLSWLNQAAHAARCNKMPVWIRPRHTILLYCGTKSH